jgi:hypothetical protein
LLRDVMAWLVINSCKSERLQYNQLQIQNLCNVWRRRAFDTLQRDAELLTARLPTRARTTPRYKRLLRSLHCFEEPIDFNVASAVPREAIDIATAMARRIKQHEDLIEDDSDRAAIADVEQRVKAQIAAAATRGRIAFESTSTLEQEQEREQEQEQEQEQEIEIEKFQDLAYARDDEQPVPWRFATLARWDDITAADIAHLVSESCACVLCV